MGVMKWDQVVAVINYLLLSDLPPSILVIHCGGNDICDTPSGLLRYKIRVAISTISRLLPYTLLVWSQILPRIQWQNEKNHSALERV